MARSSARVTGLDRVVKRMERLGTRLVADSPAIVSRALQPIEQTAKLLAPVKSGKTVASIETRIDRTPDGVAGYVEIVRDDFEAGGFYPGFVDLGTEHIEARMFMRRAFEEHRDRAEADMTEAAVRSATKG